MPKTTSTTGSPDRGAPRASDHVYTHWLTRDTVDGELSPHVRIWLAQPTRYKHPDGRGGYWTSLGREADIWGYWTLAECARAVSSHTYPEDDRQCIRVEGDGVRQPGEHASKFSKGEA